MKVYIVDDEESARGVLRFYLEESCPNVEIVGEQGDSVKAIAEINQLKPDLIFLDIQMPMLNGFEVLAYLEPRPLVVFCTAFDQYAIKAFEEHALDYLLKPVEPERLQQSMDRAASEWKKQQHLLVESVKGLQKILCSVGDGHRVVWVRDVLKISRADRYTVIHTRDNQQLYTDMTLIWLDEQIKDPDIFRLGRSCMLRKDFIKSYRTLPSGNWEITDNQGETETVPRRRVRDFKDWFELNKT